MPRDAPHPPSSPGASRHTSTNTRSRQSTSCTDRPPSARVSTAAEAPRTWPERPSRKPRRFCRSANGSCCTDRGPAYVAPEVSLILEAFFMRRALVFAGLLTLLLTTVVSRSHAQAQQGGTGGWTIPASAATEKNPLNVNETVV